MGPLQAGERCVAQALTMCGIPRRVGDFPHTGQGSISARDTAEWYLFQGCFILMDLVTTKVEIMTFMAQQALGRVLVRVGEGIGA